MKNSKKSAKMSSNRDNLNKAPFIKKIPKASKCTLQENSEDKNKIDLISR